MSVQSWLDLPVSPTIDARTLIQSCAFIDQAGTSQGGLFQRSTNWLKAVTWVSPVVKVTAYGTVSATSNLVAVNGQDFTSVEAAATWNGTHVMTTNNAQLPLVSEGLMFLKAGTNFINNVFFDFNGGVTSTDVQIGFRDNSYTSGDFTNSATGTIPVYAFPTTTTYGGTGRQLSLTLLQTGRFHMGLRIVDNGGNYSMFPMEWVVL